MLASDNDVVELDSWLTVRLQEQGMAELQALDEADAILSRAVDAIDQRLRKNATNGLISAYCWADKTRGILVRTGLDANRQEADETTSLIHHAQEILAAFSALSGRQFEHVCDSLLDTYGVPKRYRHVTPPSNEGGIDFVALRPSVTSRTGNRLESLPFRIIGQATRTGATVDNNKVDAFCKVLSDCRKAQGRAWEKLPDWFKNADAPILGLFVTSSNLGPSSRRSILDSVAFAIVGEQIARIWRRLP